MAMKNFEKSDIIRDVAYNKNKARFLSRDEQMQLNKVMKDKLMRFVTDMHSEDIRPRAMRLFDDMMNEMHGKRIKDLYAYRRAGSHVVTLLSNSIPPELVYAMGHFIPVSVCMGAGELEPYAGEETQEMCSLNRSMIGFLKTGMCVFFNLADHVLASDLCPQIRKTSEIIRDYSDELEVYCMEIHKDDRGGVSVNVSDLLEWVNKVTEGRGIDLDKLLEYAELFSEIRSTYKDILDFRKNLNPPLNGKNSIWIQQVALVEEPRKLLQSLQQLYSELAQNVHQNKGYDPDQQKKRVMLITPRNMPPFAELYRLVESYDALVVCEEIDMGITNIDYDFGILEELVNDNAGDHYPEEVIQYITKSLDVNSTSCMAHFDEEKILRKVRDFQVDTVILFAFYQCPVMQKKTKNIFNLLKVHEVPALELYANYLDVYEQEFFEKIRQFLMH